MKRTLAILLLLITAFYVLPITSGFGGENDMAGKSAAQVKMEEKSEDKKESCKEFIACPAVTVLLVNNAISTSCAVVCLTAAALHTVETPPPDFI